MYIIHILYAHRYAHTLHNVYCTMYMQLFLACSINKIVTIVTKLILPILPFLIVHFTKYTVLSSTKLVQRTNRIRHIYEH